MLSKQNYDYTLVNTDELGMANTADLARTGKKRGTHTSNATAVSGTGFFSPHAHNMTDPRLGSLFCGVSEPGKQAMCVLLKL